MVPLQPLGMNLDVHLTLIREFHVPNVIIGGFGRMKFWANTRMGLGVITEGFGITYFMNLLVQNHHCFVNLVFY